jgi:CBS domain containing-hemolysin-like protein
MLFWESFLLWRMTVLDDPQVIWIIVGSLIFLLAIISASLCSISSIRYSALEKMSEEDKGATARKLLLLLQDDKNRIISGIGILRFIFSLVVGALLTYQAIILKLRTTEIILTYALVSIVILLIFTEILPRFLACLNPEKSAGFFYPVIRIISVFAIPISKLSEKMTSPLTTTTDKNGEKTTGMTTDEIWHLVKESHRKGLLEEEEKEMIQSVFEFTGTIAREVMVPRVDIEAAPSDAKLSEVISMMIESGFSRIPIYEDTLDRILGIVYSKDVLPSVKNCNLDIPAIDTARKPPFFVPDTKPVLDLLREMQKRSISIAVIVDEYGGTSGLVTIEDLIEEIVGEITDEYDKEEPSIKSENDGTFIVDASTIIEDVNQVLHIDVPIDEHETIGGFVYGHLGHIPEKGESMNLEDLGIDIIVEDIEGQRIQALRIKKHQKADEEDQGE